jgi:hypothetical protein
MPKTLVRTQLYLDPVIVKKIQTKLKNDPKASLAKYVREALVFYTDHQEKLNTNLVQKRLQFAGKISSQLKGDEAIKHNDIYSI